MKTLIGLMMALGLVSHAALAQVSDTPASSQNTDPTPTSDTSGASSGSQSEREGEASSGASSTSQSEDESDAASGASSASQSEEESGASAEAPSGAVNGMRSEAGMTESEPPSPIAGLKPVTEGDITYLCGGVGQDEIAYMKNQAKNYDMMLTFAARNGAYLADVDVDIRDARGNSVLETTCDAPILLVDLPRSGNYRVRAETAGYTLNRSVRVADAGERRGALASAVLSWPQQVATISPPEEATGSSATGSGAGEDTEADTSGGGED